jgi:hypothetical protein
VGLSKKGRKESVRNIESKKKAERAYLGVGPVGLQVGSLVGVLGLTVG